MSEEVAPAGHAILPHCRFLPVSDAAVASARGLWVKNLLFSLLFAGAGLYFVFWSLDPLLEHRSMAGWQAHECVIQRSWLARHRPEASWELRVRYAYRSGGTSLVADRLAQAPVSFRARDEAAARLSRLAPGSEHRCFVNPDNPAEAILVRTPRLEVASWWFGLFMGGSFLVIGYLGSRRLARDHRATRTPQAAGG